MQSAFCAYVEEYGHRLRVGPRRASHQSGGWVVIPYVQFNQVTTQPVDELGVSKRGCRPGRAAAADICKITVEVLIAKVGHGHAVVVKMPHEAREHCDVLRSRSWGETSPVCASRFRFLPSPKGAHRSIQPFVSCIHRDRIY
jgi:hypothetical protein